MQASTRVSVPIFKQGLSTTSFHMLNSPLACRSVDPTSLCFSAIRSRTPKSSPICDLQTNTVKRLPQPEEDGDYLSDNTEVFSSISRDPLNWFGILVPSVLRASQSEFEVAVMQVVPKLANVLKEMREVEIEVRRARKKLSKVS